MNITTRRENAGEYYFLAEKVENELQPAVKINKLSGKIRELVANLLYLHRGEWKETNGVCSLLIHENSLPQELRNLAKQQCNLSVNALAPYSLLTSDWQDVEVVTKASAGVRGAWFFSNSERGTMVVKGQEGAEQQIIGTLFLRSFSMNAPDAKMVPLSSKEGRQISELGVLHGIDQRRPSNYIVMECVSGSDYQSLFATDGHAKMVEENLFAIGELIIYDLILGNFDRFDLKNNNFNAGNLMFEAKKIRPIDTDYNLLDAENNTFIKLAVGKILRGSGGYEAKVANLLHTHLGTGDHTFHFSEEMIKAGMKSGIAKIAAVAKRADYQQYLLSCSAMRGLNLTEFPRPLADRMSYCCRQP